jgi:hypothetical protein
MFTCRAHWTFVLDALFMRRTHGMFGFMHRMFIFMHPTFMSILCAFVGGSKVEIALRGGRGKKYEKGLLVHQKQLRKKN